jgi:uncharacterized protein
MRFAPLAACIVGLLTLSALAADPAQRTISTTGTAVIDVVPNQVSITLGVEAFDPTLDVAKGQNDKNSQSLLKAIKDAGIDDKDVKTAEMNVEIDYNRNGADEQLQGYRTMRWYTVKLKDTSKFMQLVDAALKNGANRIGGIQYDTTDLPMYRSQARALAIKAAKDKAEELARELGCETGRPITIQENGDDVSPVYYNNIRFGLGGGFGGGGGGGGDTMPLGQMTVGARVNVTFELKDLAGQ